MQLRKHFIVYSFFIFQACQIKSDFDNNNLVLLDNNHDLEIIITTDNEEIFPLDKIDMMYDIENFIENLEIDPIIDSQSIMIIEPVHKVIVDEINNEKNQDFSNDQNSPRDISDNSNNVFTVVESVIVPEENKIDETLHEDDIVPVPHELINSVKKAAKKKKKLEEKERKERQKRSRKSKK